VLSSKTMVMASCESPAIRGCQHQSRQPEKSERMRTVIEVARDEQVQSRDLEWPVEHDRLPRCSADAPR
jgi:hypothetical protein